MKSKSWPWAEVYPISSEFDEPFWLSDCSAELKSLESSSLADCCSVREFLQDQSVPPEKSIFVILLFMQSRTDCSIGGYLSSQHFFGLVELFVFHMLHKIRWIFFKGIDLSIAAR